ncbi:MAG: hypothetical protein ABSF49_21400, partial [Roseiarcus sp.]|uniref:hypothetical protein n=1 Tax=Roseiarcus sp. TaxID=1969460 RepID=UPI003C267412
VPLAKILGDIRSCYREHFPPRLIIRKIRKTGLDCKTAPHVGRASLTGLVGPPASLAPLI